MESGHIPDLSSGGMNERRERNERRSTQTKNKQTT
jgi:hypothetical protein